MRISFITSKYKLDKWEAHSCNPRIENAKAGDCHKFETRVELHGEFQIRPAYNTKRNHVSKKKEGRKKVK